MMNPDVEAWDESNIEITIARDYLSHHQTHPPVATSHADHDTPSDMYWHAYMGEWGEMKAIVRNDPDSVRIPLTGSGDTALHVAAAAGNTTFVRELTKFMETEEQLIPNSEGMLSVHLAALSRHHRIVKHLCSQQHLLDKMAYEDIEKLFFMTISNNMFDVAITIFEKCPLELSTARDEKQLTALHMLARKPATVLSMELEDNKDTEVAHVTEDDEDNDLIENVSDMKLEEEKDSGGTGIVLLKRIWAEVKKLRREEIFALITEPSVALFDAIKSESHDQVIDTFLDYITILTTVKDPQGRNLLHLLCLHRRRAFSDKRVNNRKEQLVGAVDNEGNNVLHMAALFSVQFQSFSGLNPYLQMQKALKWFKKVESHVPRELRSARNKKGKRPVEVFCDEHKQLSNDIKEVAKGIADSGMIVSTLVATVAFGAALTVPGDKNNSWFIVFIVTNAFALFSSCTSTICFLSNFTSSRFARSEFAVSLNLTLAYGSSLLIISVAAMVVAFIATSYLIFAHATKWVSYLVTSMGVSH
ncbi:hypothetical protein ACSQ67_017046 [Phaseolus vulgaris]